MNESPFAGIFGPPIKRNVFQRIWFRIRQEAWTWNWRFRVRWPQERRCRRGEHHWAACLDALTGSTSPYHRGCGTCGKIQTVLGSLGRGGDAPLEWEDVENGR